MRFKRSAVVVGTAFLVGGFGSAAFAAASATLTPGIASNTAPTSVIHVAATGLNDTKIGNLANFQQCWKDGNVDPTFNALLDCNQSLPLNANIVGGNASVDLTVFNGDDPNIGEFGCGPLSSPGVPSSNTCFIRVVPADLANTSVDQFYPFTYGAVTPPTTTTPQTTVAPPADVPEVPINVLIPVGAAAVMGGTLVVARRRHAKSV